MRNDIHYLSEKALKPIHDDQSMSIQQRKNLVIFIIKSMF